MAFAYNFHIKEMRMAPDKEFFLPKSSDIFLFFFLHENISCGYSLEAIEKICFRAEIRKNMWISHLIWGCG